MFAFCALKGSLLHVSSDVFLTCCIVLLIVMYRKRLTVVIFKIMDCYKLYFFLKVTRVIFFWK